MCTTKVADNLGRLPFNDNMESPMQAVHSSTCNNAVYEAVGGARTDRNCSSALAWWTVVFSFFELFLSQIPDFHSLWCALLYSI